MGSLSNSSGGDASSPSLPSREDRSMHPGRRDPDHRAADGKRFGLRLGVGALGTIACAALFYIVATDVATKRDLYQLDQPVLRFVSDHRSPAITDAMRVVTTLASPGVVKVAAVLIAVGLYARTKSLRWPALLVIAVFGTALLDNFFKALLDRPRPLGGLDSAAGAAFPSGHSAGAAALFGCLAYIATRNRSAIISVIVWSAAAVSVALAALSRVYLGVHWTTDVLGGVILGSFWVIATVSAVKTIGTRLDRATAAEGDGGGKQG